MIKLLVPLLFITGCTSVPYAKVGVGYKLDEQQLRWCNDENKCIKGNDPISARFEVGFELDQWTYGVSHDSQYASGAPFNDEPEYYKTEVFLDYKWGGK